jgi:hypothetical protein
MKVLIVSVMLAALVACEGGSAPGGGQTRFLLLTHNPAAGQLASAGDGQLLSLGQRACGEMDQHISPDQIVSDLSGNAQPGSAEYNTYSYIVVTAATELCPGHKAVFSTPYLPN